MVAVTLGIVRTDTLPEFANYKDTGCEESPSCLRCPLPMCKYDDPLRGIRARQGAAVERRETVRRLQQEGLKWWQIAKRLKVSTRTVHRDLQQLRQGALTAGHPAATSTSSTTNSGRTTPASTAAGVHRTWSS